MRALLQDRRGGALVEFTIVASLLFFVLFAAVEGGFLGVWWTQTEKAVEVASRRLVVRPPLAADVPATRGKNAGLDPATIRYGSLCAPGSASSPCSAEPDRSCTVTVATADTSCADATAAVGLLETMRGISPLALREGNPGLVTITYADSGIGFVGGPYVPTVTVRVTDLRYTFFAMSGLGALFGGDGASGVPVPPITVTLMGEDLNSGTGG